MICWQAGGRPASATLGEPGHGLLRTVGSHRHARFGSACFEASVWKFEKSPKKVPTAATPTRVSSMLFLLALIAVLNLKYPTFFAVRRERNSVLRISCKRHAPLQESPID